MSSLHLHVWALRKRYTHSTTDLLTMLDYIAAVMFSFDHNFAKYNIKTAQKFFFLLLITLAIK